MKIFNVNKQIFHLNKSFKSMHLLKTNETNYPTEIIHNIKHN